MSVRSPDLVRFLAVIGNILSHVLTRSGRIAILTTAILVASAAVSVRADKSVAGQWSFTITNPQGPTLSATCKLQQTGKRISGALSLPAGDAAIEGEVNGTEVTLQWTFDNFEPGFSLLVTLVGTLDDNGTIEGTADYGTFGGGTWKAQRRRAATGRRTAQGTASRVDCSPVFPGYFSWENGKTGGLDISPMGSPRPTPLSVLK